MRKGIFLVAASVLVVVVAGFLPVHVLEGTVAGTEERIFVEKVRSGDTFSLSFMHSVEKSIVRDHFRIDDTYRIILYETAFSSLNAGLPTATAPGETLIREEGTFRIMGMNRVLPGISLWVDEEYKNRLEIGERVIVLPVLSGCSLLHVSIRKAYAWEYLLAGVR
ncbi:MAG: DUF1850 domain-containing protein [Deltaproteobacteria bacterium]|nr:DUF1850 domain-containing protein [Deltaproteobacteria bacterium]